MIICDNNTQNYLLAAQSKSINLLRGLDIMPVEGSTLPCMYGIKHMRYTHRVNLVESEAAQRRPIQGQKHHHQVWMRGK